jgi:hypothetical protein
VRVGALFTAGSGSDHFCTASVVASQEGSAHHRRALPQQRERRWVPEDIVFVPDYRDGQAPLGIWTPKRLLIAPQRLRSADPDIDVRFVVFQPHDGKNIQEILGANQLAIDSRYRYLLRVTGYPDSARVRPDQRIGEKDAAVFAAPAQLCALVGWGYQRAGELSLVRGANLRWLSGYRHPRFAQPGLAGPAWGGVRRTGAAAGRGSRSGRPGGGAAGAVRDVVAG